MRRALFSDKHIPRSNEERAEDWTMQARKALLRRLATIRDWDAVDRADLEGESWLESRNTIYRFKDGVCFDVASRDPRKHARAGVLVGMRLVGWLSGNGTVFTDAWCAGACALLWHPGREGAEDATMAMTSASTSFARGHSSVHLQALRDQVPPADSQTFRRQEAAASLAGTTRPRLPSSSYRSG
jgi:hypothetical protein